MKNQIYRFCCHCIRMTLMKDNGCFFCNGKFVVSGIKDSFNKIKRKQKSEAPY